LNTNRRETTKTMSTITIAPTAPPIITGSDLGIVPPVAAVVGTLLKSKCYQ